MTLAGTLGIERLLGRAVFNGAADVALKGACKNPFINLSSRSRFHPSTVPAVHVLLLAPPCRPMFEPLMSARRGSVRRPEGKEEHKLIMLPERCQNCAEGSSEARSSSSSHNVG